MSEWLRNIVWKYMIAVAMAMCRSCYAEAVYALHEWVMYESFVLFAPTGLFGLVQISLASGKQNGVEQVYRTAGFKTNQYLQRAV